MFSCLASLVITSGCLNVLSFYIAADVLYDLGTGLEVLSPLCPHLFLEMAGLGNFAKVDLLHTGVFLLFNFMYAACKSYSIWMLN